MAQPEVEITHVMGFSAAHRLHCDQLTAAENRELYGPCNCRHGHNYELEVSVRGPVDPRTGMVMDLNRLSRLMTEKLISIVDHRDLNEDVPFLAGLVPTAENVAVAFWRELELHLGAYPGCRLHRIRVRESRANLVEYLGPGSSGSGI
jgi:6-pyruvoyltetrahydropterin/6-carboxytetrahydropterin synthase